MWLQTSSPRKCQLGAGQLRANVQPTRLFELPDYALETKITIINSSPCELQLTVIKTKIFNATLTDGTIYEVSTEDSQSISLAIEPGGEVEVTYVFPTIDRKPTSLYVEMTLGFEGQPDIQVFEGQIKAP
jgi:hypothetical protein